MDIRPYESKNGNTHKADSPNDNNRIKIRLPTPLRSLFFLNKAPKRTIKEIKTAIKADKWWIRIKNDNKKDDITNDLISNLLNTHLMKYTKKKQITGIDRILGNLS